MFIDKHLNFKSIETNIHLLNRSNQKRIEGFSLGKSNKLGLLWLDGIHLDRSMIVLETMEMLKITSNL